MNSPNNKNLAISLTVSSVQAAGSLLGLILCLLGVWIWPLDAPEMPPSASAAAFGQDSLGGGVDSGYQRPHAEEAGSVLGAWEELKKSRNDYYSLINNRDFMTIAMTMGMSQGLLGLGSGLGLLWGCPKVSPARLGLGPNSLLSNLILVECCLL